MLSLIRGVQIDLHENNVNRLKTAGLYTWSNRGTQSFVSFHPSFLIRFRPANFPSTSHIGIPTYNFIPRGERTAANNNRNKIRENMI